LSFIERIQQAVPEGLGVCVGLDPIVERMPPCFKTASEPLYSFNAAIIEATFEAAVAYKPNLAFYERYGASGWEQLAKTVKAVPEGKIVILDCKRGDIGSTSATYAEAMFHQLGADAVTVSPYLGSDSLSPFLEETEKGAFVLALTSNPGGAEVQELKADGMPVYLHIIDLCRRLNKNRNVGLVVGATRPEHWPRVLEAAGDLPLLIPGVGAQGGDPVALRRLLQGYPAPAFVNSSRAIIFASRGDDFADAARIAAFKLKEELVG